jgi:hypothetical protein
MFLALPGYGLVGYHTPLHIRAIFSCTIRTQQRYMHLPATRKKIAGVLSMRIPKQPKLPSVESDFLLRHGLRTSSCSPRTVVAGTTWILFKFRESSSFYHNSPLALFLVFHAEAASCRRRHLSIDRLSRPCLNNFLEVRQCCGCLCRKARALVYVGH